MNKKPIAFRMTFDKSFGLFGLLFCMTLLLFLVSGPRLARAGVDVSFDEGLVDRQGTKVLDFYLDGVAAAYKAASGRTDFGPAAGLNFSPIWIFVAPTSTYDSPPYPNGGLLSISLQGPSGSPVSGDITLPVGVTKFTFGYSSAGAVTAQAFDAGGSLLDTQIGPANLVSGSFSSVTLTGATIKRVVITHSSPTDCFIAGASSCAIIDNITFSTDPLSSPAAYVPPPDMVGQLGFGATFKADGSGDIVTLNLVIKNSGPGKANSFEVEFPIDPNLELLSAAFTSPKSWVTKVLSDKFFIQFGSFEKQSGPVTATIRLAVRGSAPAGTVIKPRAKGSAQWDGGGGLLFQSNTVYLRVGAGKVESLNDLIQSIGATLTGDKAKVTVSGNIFIPGELITIWINLADGSVKAVGTALIRADGSGLVSFDYSLSGLGAGNYSLVLLGERSRVQGVAAFSL